MYCKSRRQRYVWSCDPVQGSSHVDLNSISSMNKHAGICITKDQRADDGETDIIKHNEGGKEAD